MKISLFQAVGIRRTDSTMTQLFTGVNFVYAAKPPGAVASKSCTKKQRSACLFSSYKKIGPARQY